MGGQITDVSTVLNNSLLLLQTVSPHTKTLQQVVNWGSCAFTPEESKGSVWIPSMGQLLLHFCM